MAGDEPRSARCRLQLRPLDAAARQYLRTTHRERTADGLRGIVLGGLGMRGPTQDPPARASIDARHRIQQFPRVRMQRRPDQAPAPSRLDDAAAKHDHHAFAEPRDHCQVVADEKADFMEKGLQNSFWFSLYLCPQIHFT